MILCDTGPLVAAFNKADDDHERCARFLAQNWTRLVVPSLAVTEVCHLLSDPQRRGNPSLAARFLRRGRRRTAPHQRCQRCRAISLRSGCGRLLLATCGWLVRIRVEILDDPARRVASCSTTVGCARVQVDVADRSRLVGLGWGSASGPSRYWVVVSFGEVGCGRSDAIACPPG